MSRRGLRSKGFELVATQNMVPAMPAINGIDRCDLITLRPGRSVLWRTPGRVRPGYAYHAPAWVERGGRWHYTASRWDRDGDGIPNNRDRTPHGVSRSSDRHGDGIPNFRDRTPDGVVSRPRDQDGDGVSDRRDAFPNNPNRR